MHGDILATDDEIGADSSYNSAVPHRETNEELKVFVPERLNLLFIGMLGAIASLTGTSTVNLPIQLSLAIRASGVLVAVFAWLHSKHTRVALDNEGITMSNFLGQTVFSIAWKEIESATVWRHPFHSDQIALWVGRKKYVIPTIISDRKFLREAIESRLLSEGAKETQVSIHGSVVRIISRA